MWWGVNVASFQDPQDSSVMKDYFDTFCVKKDLEIENSHPSATCTDRLTLPLGPSLFQCRESRATGSGSTSPGFLFDNPLSELLVTSLSTPFVPAATQKNTHWSVGRFNDWMAHRNSLVSAESDRVPVGFLDRPDCVCNTSVLNKWLNLMALVRAQEIPTRLKQSTLSYVAYTDTYRGKFGVGIPNFLSRRNPEFKELNGATDRHYRDLRAKNIGAKKKHAQPLSEESIETLWSSKAIGVDSSQALLNAVFFLNGKNFALRNSEYYSLKISQLT